MTEFKISGRKSPRWGAVIPRMFFVWRNVELVLWRHRVITEGFLTVEVFSTECTVERTGDVVSY